MADLLTDPAAVKESWRQMAATDTTALEGPKTIDPNAKLKLAARDQAADPFAGLQEVKPNDPFAGLQEVKPHDAFAGLKPADSLDLTDTKSLVDDDTFHPADYLGANPDLRKDGAKSQKLLDIYRAKRERGLEIGKVLNAARKEALPIVGKTLLGVRDLGARFIESAIQPAATSVLSALTGATAEEKAAIMAEQGKEQLRAAGEVTAGTESAITGLTQLGHQGARKLFGKSPAKMTDAELFNDLALDSEFSKATKEVSEGRGDAAKAAGLDADTLAKSGVTLDKDAIEHLSLVDPLTLVATAGAFKVVGLGGKVIATAATKVGAQVVIDGLAKVAQTVGAKGVEVAGKTAEKIGQVGGVIGERFPAKSVGFVLGATKTGTLQGGAVGAAAGESAKRIVAGSAEALSKRGAALTDVGRQLSPNFVGPQSAGVARVLSLPSTAAGKIATSAAKGAVQGAVTALPLVAAADDSQTAGALLGGGLALGAIHGAVTGTKSAVAETVAKNYLDPHNIPFEKTNSPGYGKTPAFDAIHEAAIKTLPENDQNAINTMREGLRAGEGEIYVQDQNAYLERIRENIQNENGGKPLTPEQESQAKLYADTHAFFDGQVSGRRVVFLNSDAKGLFHDSGHLFQAILSPEQQAALRNAVFSHYTPEYLSAFKEEYARRLGEPDYFDKLGDEANAKAADELIAENFGQLFQNKTFAELSSPRPFLKKLGDTAVKAAEALGLDLTAGRTTADLGAKPSFRLQDLLRNAAQDVLTREPAPAPKKKPLALRPEDVARRELNKPVTKEILPEEVKPVAEVPKPAEVKPAEVKPAEVKPAEVKPIEVLPKEPVSPRGEKPVVSETPPTTAKNIRVERTAQEDFASKRAEETGIAEAQKATESQPEVRKVVDDIAASMEAGNPVLEIEHRGIVSEKGPANPEGRTSRRGTRAAGYEELQRLQVENRKEAPADIVDLHQKTFVPVRFTTQGGKPTLIAMSLDKVIANVVRVVKDAVANTAEKLLPYPVENGKLTDAGWKKAIDDIKAYAENQSNGYRGDGTKLTRPTEDIGVSIPAENPNYNPKGISEGAMNFANLVQGLAPPETGRVQKGLTPGNVKGQMLAEINAKQPLTPAVIGPEHVTKQEFKGFEPRTVKETNPLRNELAARGVKVRELTEVTERLAVQDIASVKPRPEIGFKAPVTDVIRGGFLPGKETDAAIRSGMLPDTKPSEPTPSSEIRSLATNYAKGAGIEYRPSRTYSALDPSLSKRLADFYEGAKSNPADPAVKASYDALSRETMAQYRAITDAGYKIEPYTGEGEPYKNSAAAVSDIRDNKHLFFFQTDKAFGTGAESSTNPMLADSGVIIDGKRLPVNDVFRAVHDFFGHGKEGYQFGPRGEFNAWRAHSEMYSPEAQGALAAETLAQNSWVNFGKHLRDAKGNIALKGEPGYVAPQDRPFAEQKNVVVPSELIDAARKSAGESPKFMPGDKPVSELGKDVAGMSADEWKKFTESNGGHLTPEAYKLGLGLTDKADLELLRKFQADHEAKGKEALTSGDFGTAMTEATKGQFFREAAEAATDTGSAANPRMGWRKVAPDAKPPFAGDVSSEFLPRTEAGKQAAEKGFDIAIKGNLGIREAVITKDGVQVGKIVSSSQEPAKASINSADVSKKLRGQGLGEAAYRELLAQLKEDGVKEVNGITVSASPLAIREKIFGKGSTEITDPEGIGSERGNIPVDQAISELETGGLGFTAKNEITPESNFLPNDKPQSDFTKNLLKKEGWKFDRTDYPTAKVFRLKSKDGEFVGDLQIFPDRRVKNFAEVGAVEVDQKFRGRGAAEALYREAANVLQSLGVTRLGGDFLTQAPINLRQKLFGDFEFFGDDLRKFDESEARSRLPNQPAATLDESVGRRTDKVYGVSKISPDVQFFPRKKLSVEDVQKRDEQNRPLTKGGLVDYTKLYAEKTQKDKSQEAADLKSIEGKYTMPKDAPKAGPATGWILPNQEFVPLDANYHEQFLANNSASLNKKFGTRLSGTPDVNERFDALNKGFVRVRYTPNDGAMRVELAASNWNPKTKQAILNQIESQSDNIDRLYVALADKKGGVADSITENVSDLEGAAKFSALEEAVSKLRGTGPKFLTRLPKRENYGYLGDVLEDGEVRAIAGNLATTTHGDGGVALESMWRYNPATKKIYWWSVDDLNKWGNRVQDEIEAAGHDVIGQLRIMQNPATFEEAHAFSKEFKAKDFFPELRNPGAKFLPPDETPGQHAEPNGMFTVRGLKNRLKETRPDLTEEQIDSEVRKFEQRARLFFDGKFLPPEGQNLPGMNLPSLEEVQQRRVRARIAKAKDRFPEALPPRYKKDETGRFVMGKDGKPKPILEGYRFDETPVAREAAKGLRGKEREDAVVSAIGDKLVKAAKVAQKNPDIAAGVTWYSTARSRLKKILGNDTKFLSELLGATSARTPVGTNFRFSLDAYNQFKRGAYDDILKKYREGKDRWESGETDGFPTRAAFMDSWVQKHDLTPRQSNGKKFAMNSGSVLKVLDGSWAETVVGPKTPNFAGNLSGSTFEATIDIWASRLIHRLANEGNDKPWRILPENETGLSDADFALGQSIFRKAADKLGMKPDALQAILWFAEKDHWEKNGWTRGTGAEKSDFNSLLKETELTPSGVLKQKSPQLGFDLGEADIKPKKK